MSVCLCVVCVCMCVWCVCLRGFIKPIKADNSHFQQTTKLTKHDEDVAGNTLHRHFVSVTIRIFGDADRKRRTRGTWKLLEEGKWSNGWTSSGSQNDDTIFPETCEVMQKIQVEKSQENYVCRGGCSSYG